jgi:putative ABC transport system substrate-binding protein
MLLHRQMIGDFAAKNRLILVGNSSWLPHVGGLLNYGADVTEMTRKAAGYVDKILRGARPSDLPMQQPAMFQLVINLKAAKSLGLVVPPTLLARADDVLE